MKAIILAAGRGKRLKKYFSKPKGLIKIPKTKITILERNISILNKYGCYDIIIAVGYKSNLIKKIIKSKARYLKVKNYIKYNNLQTLFQIRKELDSNLLILFADVIFDERIIKELVKSKFDICLAVDKNKKLKDTMKIKLKKNQVSCIGNHILSKNADGNFIGLAKFSKKGAKILYKGLEKYRKRVFNYYTKALDEAIKNRKVNIIDVNKKFWMEIDTLKDLLFLKKSDFN